MWWDRESSTAYPACANFGGEIRDNFERLDQRLSDSMSRGNEAKEHKNDLLVWGQPSPARRSGPAPIDRPPPLRDPFVFRGVMDRFSRQAERRFPRHERCLFSSLPYGRLGASK
jgi:hypothetical protein